METQEAQGRQRAEAAAALKQIADARAALAERTIPPWWWYPALGIWVCGCIATQTQKLGDWARIATVIACLVAMQWLIRAGVKATGFRGRWLDSGRERRWIIALALVVVALFLAGVALHAVWGWVGPVLVGIVAVPVVIVLGRLSDAAVRADVRRRA